jgi:hypothetical protein
MTTHSFKVGCRVEDVVSHRRGTVIYVGEHLLGIRWDDSGISLPAQAVDLRKVTEENPQ